MSVYVALATVFVVAGGITYILTPFAARLGRHIGLVDHPRAGEIQRLPVPRSGGYAIFAGLIVAVVVALIVLPRQADEYPKILGMLLGALVILPIAIFDDFKRLGPLPQFVGQVVAAGCAIASGIMLDNVANPFGGLVYIPFFLAAPLTVIWFAGMVNTLNFIDTMDGLAAGITGIAAIILFVRAASLAQFSVAALMLALAGAALGFLPHNIHPARVFMGSSGSMLLGYSLAALAILGGAKVATIAMVMGIPILDTAMVIVQRLMRGRSPFRGGDNAHLPHRLLAIGMHQRSIAILLYALCLLLGYLGLALGALHKLYVLSAMVALVAILALLLLLRRRGDSNNPVPKNPLAKSG